MAVADLDRAGGFDKMGDIGVGGAKMSCATWVMVAGFVQSVVEGVVKLSAHYTGCWA